MLKVAHKFMKVTRSKALAVRLFLVVCAFLTTVHLLCCGYMGVNENEEMLHDEENERHGPSMQYAIVVTTVSAPCCHRTA